MTDCVLCDWTFDPFGEPIAVYLPDAPWPVRWYPDGPAPAAGSDGIAETIGEVAVVAHWAVEHELHLRLALGRRDWKLRPVGWYPPVDTTYAVDLAPSGKQGGKTTVVKATKVWIAKAFGVPQWVADQAYLGDQPPPNPEPGTIWIDAGPMTSQMTIEYIDPE